MSLPLSTDVGSSSRTTSGRSTSSSSVSALASSTICRAAKVNSEVRAVTSISTPIFCICRAAACRIARQFTTQSA